MSYSVNKLKSLMLFTSTIYIYITYFVILTYTYIKIYIYIYIYIIFFIFRFPHVFKKFNAVNIFFVGKVSCVVSETILRYRNISRNRRVIVGSQMLISCMQKEFPNYLSLKAQHYWSFKLKTRHRCISICIYIFILSYFVFFNFLLFFKFLLLFHFFPYFSVLL